MLSLKALLDPVGSLQPLARVRDLLSGDVDVTSTECVTRPLLRVEYVASQNVSHLHT